MRDPETYRASRRNKARQIVRESDHDWRSAWSGLREPMKTLRYGYRRVGSKYTPHQGKRECARRA